jgi:hypothetical protein
MSDLWGGTLPIPLEAQVREVQREIELRRRVYPAQVQNRRLMTQATADRQIAIMEAVLATLKGLERPGG